MSQRNVFVEKMLVTYKLCSVPASLQVLRPSFGAPHVLELTFLFPHASITALKKNIVPNMKGTNSRFGPVQCLGFFFGFFEMSLYIPVIVNFLAWKKQNDHCLHKLLLLVEISCLLLLEKSRLYLNLILQQEESLARSGVWCRQTLLSQALSAESEIRPLLRHSPLNVETFLSTYDT